MSSTTSPALVPANGQHPLHNQWTMWYDSKKNLNKDAIATAEWVNTLMEVKSFASVEEFWGLYTFIKKPSMLEVGASYNYFKKGVKPAWEDPQCAKGGKWVVPLQGEDLAQVDRLWELTLLALIGERLEDGPASAVLGAVLNKRRDIKIAVWVNDATDGEAVLAVGRAIRKELNIADPRKAITFVTLEAVPKVLYTLPPSAQ